MATGAQITLPVSLGEALDKLTILDIKLQKITDSRRQDVQAEYDALYTSLKEYVVAYPYHYKILRDINLTLWTIQEHFHGKDITPEEAATDAKTILLENDRRFRVKLKINTLAASALKEQKGYALKKALFYGHLGLGDMFWMNGAVRYLATCYDQVLVVCKKKYESNAAAMYADDPSIQLLLINDDIDLHPWQIKRSLFEEQGYTVYSCGFFASKASPTIYDLPYSFYDDLALPRDVRTSYFHVSHTDAARNLFRAFACTPYIVVHQQSSVKTIPLVETMLAAGEPRLILDLNKNHYPAYSKEWFFAELVVNKPVLDYTYLLEGAEELHMIESSLYCLASHLDLSRVKVKKCYEAFGGDAERLGVFENGVTPPLK